MTNEEEVAEAERNIRKLAEDSWLALLKIPAFKDRTKARSDAWEIFEVGFSRGVRTGIALYEKAVEAVEMDRETK